jgi:hypothetical protein
MSTTGYCPHCGTEQKIVLVKEEENLFPEIIGEDTEADAFVGAFKCYNCKCEITVLNTFMIEGAGE